MPNFRMPPQILRLILLTVVIVATYFVARRLLTPDTFGYYGHYRAAALGELSARTPRFAGAKACNECHDEVVEKVAKDRHKTLACETCHGAGRTHARNPDVTFVKLANDTCLRCHTSEPARPPQQKQVDPVDHYHGDRCVECHFPHQPNKSPSL
jgi:hypothetical protein